MDRAEAILRLKEYFKDESRKVDVLDKLKIVSYLEILLESGMKIDLTMPIGELIKRL